MIEVDRVSYPATTSAFVRERSFVANPFGRLSDLVVAEEDGAIVAQAFLFRLKAFFGGVSVKAGGIAYVAVAPEARGRGIATALMAHLHLLSDRRGDAVTMLYAFRHGFYAPLGYVPASSRKRLSFDPRSIPDPWRALARGRVRGAKGTDRALLQRLHARAAERTSGMLARTSMFWDSLFARERRIIFVDERRAGYVAFELEQPEAHAPTTLIVDELIADDDETRRMLLGALGAMRDQVTEIVLEVAESDPLERGLLDPDARRHGTAAVEHVLGELVGGPLVRAGEPALAIASRGYLGDGTFAVRLSEPGAAASPAVTLGVRVEEGRATVTTLAAPRRGSPLLTTTRAGLAAIFYGALPASSAVALGLADADPAAAAKLDAIVRLPPVVPIDAF